MLPMSGHKFTVKETDSEKFHVIAEQPVCKNELHDQ